MKNIIDFFFREENETGNVMLNEMVILVSGQVPDIGRIARDQIVDRDNAMTFRQQAIRQVRPQKTGGAGNDGDWLRTSGHLALI